MNLGKHDPFRNVDSWDESTAAEWVAALELRASADDQKEFRRRIRTLAHLKPGDHVVEIGCGVGALLYELAEDVAPGGTVIGVEPQSTFASAAELRLTGLTVENHAEVHREFADALRIPNDQADACIAQTVLIHLPLVKLKLTLKEMVRVTKTGGRVISVDQDGDTWVVDHPDREITRRIVKFNTDQRFADGWTGRKLRRYFHECGLVDIKHEAWNHIDTEHSSYLFNSCVRLANATAAAGEITHPERNKWLSQLNEIARQDQFFSCITYFAVSGIKA